MKGLLYKDLLLMVKNGKMFFLLVVAFGVGVPLLGAENGDVTQALPFMALMISLLIAVLNTNSIAYDIQAKWDAYALSLPMGHNKIISAKYLMALLSSASGALASFLLYLVIGVFVGGLEWGGLGLALASGFITALLYVSVMLPVQYKFGVEKSRIVFMLFIVLIYSSAFLISKLGGLIPSINFTRLSPPLIGAAVLLFVALVFYASYCVSLKIYRHKEF